MKLRIKKYMPFLTGLILLIISGCANPTEPPQPEAVRVIPESIQITSTSFGHGDKIPTIFTCDGEDISPALTWQNIPDGTRSLVLIVRDPDAPAGEWVHWLLYDIPSNVDSLPEAIPTEEIIPGIGTQGSNDFGLLGYGGPCPPGSNPHRYFFNLYAIDTMLELKPGIKIQELNDAMQGHQLARGEMMGTYGR
jgi:hypothetical protein